MKIICILISVIVLNLTTCKINAKNDNLILQSPTTQKPVQERQLTTAKYGGVYSFGNNKEKPHGKVYIYPEIDSTVLFYFYVSKGAPSYNMGSLAHRLNIRNQEGFFNEKLAEGAEYNCSLNFKFDRDLLYISEAERNCDCGFGHGVYVNHKFIRKTKEIPLYYFSISGEKTTFAELQEVFSN